MKKQSFLVVSVLACVAFAVSVVAFLFFGGHEAQMGPESQESQQNSGPQIQGDYEPMISPYDFSTKIDNRYFPLVPGTKFVYEGQTEDGLERVEVYVTNETRKVMGVDAVVVWDREWLEGELIEDTKDWFAQDRDGNVWYFGEESKELAGGKVISTEGSWKSGISGAKPGILVKADPKVGEVYRQEYYPGEAEDMAEVLSLDASIETRYGSFSGCLKTREWNPLERDSYEEKYYCPGFGLVYEVGVKDGEGLEIVDFEEGAEASEDNAYEEDVDEGAAAEAPAADQPQASQPKKITQEEAVEIAKGAVDGEFVDVEVESKLGKIAYVVEMDVDGTETDVIVDMETGKVLGIET